MPPVSEALRQLIQTAIRVERERAGLTQRELGERMGLSAQVVHTMERGSRPVSLDETPALCRALGVTLAQFLRDADVEDLEALDL